MDSDIPMFLAPIRASTNTTAAVTVSAVSPPVPPPPTPVVPTTTTTTTTTPVISPSVVSPTSRQSSISSSMSKGQASYASGALSPSAVAATAAGSFRPSPPSAVAVTILTGGNNASSATSVRTQQLAERLARPTRTKEEIAASIKARHEASTKRREEFINNRQSRAASSAASAVASLTSSLEAAAAIKAQQLQPPPRTDIWGHLDEELPAVYKKRTKTNDSRFVSSSSSSSLHASIPQSYHHTGGVAVDFGHLVATPKATDDSLWSDSGVVPHKEPTAATSSSSSSPNRTTATNLHQQRQRQHSPPQPSLLKRLLEKSPQRVSAVSRMVKNAAAAAAVSPHLSVPHSGIAITTAPGSSGPSAMPSHEDPSHDFLNSSTYSYASEDDHLGDNVDEGDEEVDDDVDDDAVDNIDGVVTDELKGSSPLRSRLAIKSATGLTPEAISATLRSASAKRSEALEQRRSAARAQVQAVTSRLTLLHQTQAREKAKKRVVAAHGPDAATLRRAEKLLERAKRAIEDAERAAAVSQRVRAARRLQSWFRFRKILHLGEKEAEGGEHEARTAVIEELVLSEQVAKAANQQNTTIHSSSSSSSSSSLPPQNNTLNSVSGTTSFSPLLASSSSSLPSSSSSSLHDIIEAAKTAVNAVLSPASKRSLEVLQRAISGQPSLDSGESLEAARIAAAEEEKEAYKKAGRQPPPPMSPKELPAAIPYGSFDDCALAIQQRGVLAAAQVCTTVIMRAFAMLEDKNATTSLSSSTSSLRTDDTNKTIKHTKERESNVISLSAALRPSVAKSPRTLLAALLIAYFPNEILYTGFDEASSSSSSSSSSSNSGSRKLSASKQQRNDELVVAAKAMLAAMHSFCGIVLNDAEHQQQQHDVTTISSASSASSYGSKWWLSKALGATSRTIGARSLAYGLDGLAPDQGLDASAFVSPELRIALQQQQEYSTLTAIGDVDRQARVIHSLLAFNQAWVKYMDAFMVWKLGDGMRISQTLALPFRRLALKRMELFFESNTKIGEGDAGLEQLREGVENQLAQLRAQLVSLLGADGAVKWEKDQISSMEAERVREVKNAKAQMTHVRKESQGSSTTTTTTTSSAAAAALSPNSSSAVAPSLPSPERASSISSPSSSSSSSLSSTTPRRVSASPSMPLFKQVLGNEVLAHELLLDPTFRLPEPATGEDLNFYEDEELDDDDNDNVEFELLQSNTSKQQQQQTGASVIAAASGLEELKKGDDDHVVDIEKALSSDGLELGSADNATGATTILHTASIHDRPLPATTSTTTSSTTSVPSTLGDTITSFSDKVSAPSHSRSPVLTAAVAAVANDSQFTTTFKDMSTQASSSSIASPMQEKGVDKDKVRGGRRHTIRGKLNMQRVAQDPQLLRMSAGFWEASLRAAEDHATAEIKAEISKRASAAILRGLPPPTTAPPLTQHHAVDLVCASLESVRDSIISVLPNRPDIQTSISSKIDPALFKRMLLNRAFSHSDWLGFLRFVANTIMSLEAPVRQEDTKKWLSGAEAHIKRIAIRKAEQQARQGRMSLNALDEEKKTRESSSSTISSSSTTTSASRTPVFGPAIPALVLASAAGAALDSSFSLHAAASTTAPTSSTHSPLVVEIKPILDSALLSLLPRVLAWAHFKISLIKLDTSNYHLMTLAPFLLQGGKGAEYEKARFDEKLAKGEARLSGTKLWYSLAVDECIDVAKRASDVPSSGGSLSESASATLQSSLRQAITRDSKLARLIILRDGILSSLLAICEHPLTQVAEAAARNPEGGYVRVPSTTTTDVTKPSEHPSSTSSVSTSTTTTSDNSSDSSSTAAASAAVQPSQMTKILPFPETLHLDAKRLQDLQNVIQRSALVVTLSAITQQIVSSSPVVPAGSLVTPSPPGSLITNLSELQKACVDWLKDESLRLQDLTSGIVAAADAIARSAGRSPFLAPFPNLEAEKLGEKLSKSLLSLISKAVATNHPLYSAFSKRILEYVRHQVTNLLQETLPSQSANADVDTSDGGSPELAVYWKRLAVSEGEITLPGVRTSISPHCKKDIMTAVDALARLLRHNHAVYDDRYRAMQAAIRKDDADEALRLAAERLRNEAEKATKDALAAAATGSSDAAEVVLKAGDVVLSAVEAQRAASASRTRND